MGERPHRRRSRIGARLAGLWFLVSVALLVWPVYPWLGNHVHPRVLGLPWSLVWVLLGEIFPNRIRASALAVAAAAQWMANFTISVSFPSLSAIGLSFAYGLYAAFALISFIFVFTQVPETKGRELEDMTD